MKDKQINIRVEEKIHAEILNKAKSEGRGISEIIRQLLITWLRSK